MPESQGLGFGGEPQCWAHGSSALLAEPPGGGGFGKLVRLGLVWPQKLSCRSKGKTQGNDSLSQRPQHWSDSWPTGRLPVTMRWEPSDLIPFPGHCPLPGAAGTKPFSCSASRTREASMVSRPKWTSPSSRKLETGPCHHFITVGMTVS